MSGVEGLLAYPNYPGRANVSYISSQHSGTVCTRVSAYFDGKVTLLVGPTFLHINTVTQLGQLSQGETIRAYASAVGSGKGVSFFLIQTFAKVDLAGRVTFPQINEP